MALVLDVDETSVIRLLKQLVRINSVNPHIDDGPGEREISDFIAEHLKSLGLEVHRQDVVDGRQNIIGVLKGESDGLTLMMNGHIDTVGISGMTIDPFKPVTDGNRIYGRGTCDMKGSIAGMIGAIDAIVNSGIELNGTLLITAVVDEEWASKGTEKLVEDYRSDVAIVGEPTGGQIVIAHKGFVCVEIKAYGKAAHGSIPDMGINAIENMARLICAFNRLREIYSCRKHKLLGSPSVYCSLIEGGADCSVIPDFRRLLLEKRTIPGETGSTTIGEVKSFTRLQTWIL